MWRQGPWTGFRLVLTIWSLGSLIQVTWTLHATMCIGEPHQPFEGDQVSIGSGTEMVMNNTGNKMFYSSMQPESGCFDPGANHTLTISAIKYTSADIKDPDNVLFGWLHLLVTADPIGIDMLVMQPYAPVARPSSYVPGSFVTTDFNDNCKEMLGRQEADITVKEILAPCFFVPDPSVEVPQVIAFASNPAKRDATRLVKARFNFQADFPECGQLSETSNLEFRAFASSSATTTVCSTRNTPKFNHLAHKKIFFKNNVYGASDPEPPKKHPGVSCGQELANGDPSWITAYQTHVTYPVNGNGDCYYHSTYRDITDPNYGKHYDKFIGRCSKAGNNPWGVAHTIPYNCFKDHPGAGTRPPYKPPVGSGAEECAKVKAKCNDQINITRTMGISTNSNIGKYVWGYRISHGIAMCFSAMIIIPTGTLFARFFKETYMPFRFINIHIWHGIHISSALMGFSGLFSGIMAATIGRFYFGYSWHIVASLHAVFGWLSVILYFVSIGSAPFRRFSMMPRKVTIFGHFFLGSLTRFLFTICLLTSFYISASPAGQYDVHINVKFEPDIAIVLVWIVVDIAIHLLLQLQMLKLDKVKPRKYAFGVPIPTIRPSRVEDAPNNTIRKLLLLAHVVVSIICAFGLSLKMCMRDPAGRRFGKMGYTHKSNGKLNIIFSDSTYDGD